VDVYVRSIKNSDLGKEIILSKARGDNSKGRELVEAAFQEKQPINVKITNVVKDGVIGNYEGVDIYIHRTQLEMSPVEDLDVYRGKQIEILVTQYDPDKKRLRVSGSRRVLLTLERREKASAIWSELEPGKVFQGTVRSLTDFGAFVDIGGVDGLVHVSELSWNRIRHPSEIVKPGDVIEVYIKDFDPEKHRISLGYKKVENDPYRDVEERFPVGTIITGKIVRMFPFGAFVEIAPGVDALCHISQISNMRLVKPSDALRDGMEVTAKVMEVNSDTRRISISIKEVEPIDPIRTAEPVYTEYEQASPEEIPVVEELPTVDTATEEPEAPAADVVEAPAAETSEPAADEGTPE
jgi:small subunit ribosomal protein S1